MRLVRNDAGLNALNDERDHLAVQISLAADVELPDPKRLSALRQKLAGLEVRIENYRPLST